MFKSEETKPAANEENFSLRATRRDERRARIAIAAREVFHENGFDASTTAEIANRASVGIGTLFRYAADKNELLLMVLNDELETITAASISSIDLRAPVVDQLVAFYRRRFAYWSTDVGLARAATAYVYMGSGSVKPERLRAQARERQQLEAISQILKSQLQRGTATLRHDAQTGAQMVQYIYRGEMRRWLGQKRPKLSEAMDRLRTQFQLVVDGLYATGDPQEFS